MAFLEVVNGIFVTLSCCNVIALVHKYFYMKCQFCCSHLFACYVKDMKHMTHVMFF